jgi:acetyl-CoA acetyltransferase
LGDIVRSVRVTGAAMTRFGKHADRSARDLVEEAVAGALGDAQLDAGHVQAAYVGNLAAGLISGQESIRGQVVLRRTGLMGVPIVNVENGCPSSATALHLGWQAVAGGLHDCVVVVGFEKFDFDDRRRADLAINATHDLSEVAELFGPSGASQRNVFVEMIGAGLTARGGSDGNLHDPEVLAAVAVKNRWHGSLNPNARYRDPMSTEQVMESPAVAGQLTRFMVAPLADGAACVVLCADGFRPGRRGRAEITASILLSGRGDDMRLPYTPGRTARRAYEMAGASPEDLDVVELYDVTASMELIVYGELGLCAPEDAGRLVRDRVTWLGGRVPVNTSGGLLSRGHAIGATGVAQVVELVWQLEGRCGARQVPSARLALAEINGGWVGSDVAACCVHILQA